MEGDKFKNQYGISQRTIQKIFGILHDKAEQQHANAMAIGNNCPPPFEFTIEVSLLEIYNDEGRFVSLGFDSFESDCQQSNPFFLPALKYTIFSLPHLR